MKSKQIPASTARSRALLISSNVGKAAHSMRRYCFIGFAALAGILILYGLSTSPVNAVPPEAALSTVEQAQQNGGMQTRPQHQETFARGRIIVKPRAGLPVKAFENLLREHDGKAHKIGQSNIFVVDVPEYAEEGIVARLQHHPFLQYAELDHAIEPAFVPNDPQYVDQWHLPKINAPQAWDETQGSGVTIAILDSGVNSKHPDLIGQILPGWNVYDENNDTTDLNGHGTWVTGTAAAISNNSIGVVGVANQSKVLPIKITPFLGGGTYESIITKGIVYAADHGAQIVSASYQNVMGWPAARDAAQYMRNKDGLVTVSAGNDNRLAPYLETDLMIQVAATNQDDQRAYFSNYGNYVDIAAPGIDIMTTDKDGGYAVVKGTSFSTPMTAAVLALMWSANPTLSNLDVERLLFETAVDLGEPGKDIYFGYGRIDAAAAVQAAINAVPSVDTQPPVTNITDPLDGATVSGLVTVDVDASDDRGVTRVELHVGNTAVATDDAAPYAFVWDSNSAANGETVLTAYAFDAAGNSSASSVQVIVDNFVEPPPPVGDVEAPVVRITNPQSGSVSGKVAVNVDAEDNSGAAGIALTLEIDGAVVATGSGGQLSYNWNTNPRHVSQGAHTIEVIARDQAGNTSSARVDVTIAK